MKTHGAADVGVTAREVEATRTTKTETHDGYASRVDDGHGLRGREPGPAGTSVAAFSP